MCDNQYDSLEFFSEYEKMPRSSGLINAGEWHQLKKMFPPFEGKRVLDLGCGFGWHSKYASSSGAEFVLGIDSSDRMLKKAKEINSGSNIEYRKCSLEEYDYLEDSWDIVISNLVLHYIENLDDIFKGVYRTLRSNGEFIFNIEHPVFTSGINQDWVYDSKGNILHWPVDNYYYPGRRDTIFLGKKIIKFHHTLSQILNGILSCGFSIKQVEEAYPAKEMLSIPGMKDEMKRPMMLMVKAIK